MIKNIFTVAPTLVKLLGSMAHNEQGFVQAWDLKNVKPETAADWKTNVQDKLQKLSDVCPAETEADSEQMPKLTMSCHACTKPHVVGCFASRQ